MVARLSFISCFKASFLIKSIVLAMFILPMSLSDWDAVVSTGDDVAVPVGSYANEDITADRPLFNVASS
jgi:hypothetical protein